MGFNFRKSIKIGPARVNISKSGVGYSVGAKGFRYTKRAGSKKSTGLLGPIWKLLLIGLVIFVLMAVTAAVYTLFQRFKGILIALAVLIVVAVITFLVIRSRVNTKEHDQEQLPE